MGPRMRGQQAELRFGDVLLLALQHAIVLATVDSYGTQWVSKSQYFLGFIEFDLQKCCKVCKLPLIIATPYSTFALKINMSLVLLTSTSESAVRYAKTNLGVPKESPRDLHGSPRGQKQFIHFPPPDRPPPRRPIL